MKSYVKQNLIVRPFLPLAGLAAGFGSFCLALLFFFFFICRLFFSKKTLPRSSSATFNRTVSENPYSKLDHGNRSALFRTQFFTYKELQEATHNFDPSEEIGSGSFGTVYHGKLRDGRSVAVKRLYENNYKCVAQFKNEIAILSPLHHPNLVVLYGCSVRHSREHLLVYEFIPNGTVADHLHGHQAKALSLKWSVRMSIAIETADALAYLHAVEIIHCDVKTSNILLDKNFHVKVADFGLSRLFPAHLSYLTTAPRGTIGYVDPDYYHCYQLTNKSDVYSFGVVLVELISSKPAVDITRDKSEINLASMAINKIQIGALHELVDPNLGFESNLSVKRMISSVAELAFRCLQDEKEMRPTMREAVEVLRAIQSEDCKMEMALEVEIPVDDVALLKEVV